MSTASTPLTPTNFSHSQDIYYMQLAIAEAAKGVYTTRPNPAVGCVLVKHGQIIGTGYHPKAGQPHAEVFALREAGMHAVGSCAYVTLEPCSHTGRTPPCADALIAAGVSRVVVAGTDPNPNVAGRGIERLRQAGMEVVVGVCQTQAEILNQGFLKAMRQQMPYVRLKLAISLDGRIAMASGQSQWITSIPAREDVQKLRASSAAIITGSQTVLMDNPSLTVRSPYLGVALADVPQPKVVVLDRRQRLNKGMDLQVCQRESTLFWHKDDLSALLATLVREHHCYDVLVEAGAAVSGSFLAQGLVDELIIYQAPCLLGHEAQPMARLSLSELSEQLRFVCEQCQPLGADLKLLFKPLR